MSEVIRKHDFRSDSLLSPAEAVCTTIAEALADAEGVSPLDIDPLYESVDVDALGRFLDTVDPDDDVSVAFTHGEWAVTVHADGRVVVDGT
ncbi:hypothetical protein G9464_00340 [Halostella sp. JP-L12]|uniref:HalOD1 output domain-containing protein n=1 Tax=Halostella TaxID=1843185 RepID=UPI0013CEB5E0|nr:MULTISPECIES: HalOD1 output domain-containing protein [Halostella]NHN46045.1 hypothetical protein [Halostella sp. JP-L12]